ncbi:MAG: hypothetical protein OEY19_11575 [Gammaproteobacteria bacterium]|nr:hypothetical protein [Gammaproteobacteria bacterium]MDH5629340.1 hypothetical protein [Gammaproteobacteria bacterium]
MFRFLVKLLLLTVGLSIGSIFYIKWKVEKGLDYFSRNLPPFYSDFSYEDVSVNFDGEITVHSVVTVITGTDHEIATKEVRFYMGDLFELIFGGTPSLNNLPEKFKIEAIHSFEANDEIIKKLNESIPITEWDIIEAAGCGHLNAIRAKEAEDMGFHFYVSNRGLSYEFDISSGAGIFEIYDEMEGVTREEYRIKVENIGGLLSNLQEQDDILLGLMQLINYKPDISFLEMKYVDIGYNSKKAEYCSVIEEIEAESYYEHQTNTVSKMFQQLEIPHNETVVQAYQQYLQPESVLSFQFNPSANTNWVNYDEYSVEELVSIVGMKAYINDKQVDFDFEGWTNKKLDKILDLKKEKVITENDAAGGVNQYQTVMIYKAFEEIGIASIKNYVGFKAKIKRKDGNKFEGTIDKLNSSSIMITIYSKDGKVQLPILLEEIASIEVYKEVKRE